MKNLQTSKLPVQVLAKVSKISMQWKLCLKIVILVSSMQIAQVFPSPVLACKEEFGQLGRQWDIGEGLEAQVMGSVLKQCPPETLSRIFL